LDKIYDDACFDTTGPGGTCKDEILEFRDEKNRTAFHLAAEHGQPLILEWCIKMWKAVGKQDLILEALSIEDTNGMTPLVVCCYKGYISTTHIEGKSTTERAKSLIMENRKKCVKLLLDAIPKKWVRHEGASFKDNAEA